LETIILGATRIATDEHELGLDAELLVVLLDAHAVLLLCPIVAINSKVLGYLLVKDQERSTCTTTRPCMP
jgi:hypothetical protein